MQHPATLFSLCGHLDAGSWRGQSPLQLWDLGSGQLMSNLPFHQEEPEGCQLYAAKFGEGGHVACGGSGPHARAQVTRQVGRLDLLRRCCAC